MRNFKPHPNHNSLESHISKAVSILKQADIENAWSEVILVLCKVLYKPKAFILAHPELSLDHDQEIAFYDLIQQRTKRIPMAYLLKTKEFYGLAFHVNESTLIPRPETEHVVDYIIQNAPANCSILDIGTGSGCIPIAVCKHRSDIHFLALDISSDALSMAQENATRHAIKAVDFRLIHPEESFDRFASLCDWVVSNPPYIAQEEWESLQLEIRLYEPRDALFGGQQGVWFYRRFSRELKTIQQKNGGMLVLEVGASQRSLVTNLFNHEGWNLIKVIQDYGGRDRVLIFR